MINIDKEELREKLEGGLTSKELAEYFKCGESTIVRRKKAYNLVGITKNGYNSNNRDTKLTHELLLSLLDYNKDTGIFIWKVDRHGKINKGDTAGYLHRGYVVITVNGTQYFAHRLAYFYIEREIPDKNLEIDHINHIKDDNSYKNLRLVTASENQKNRPVQSNNKSNIVGVVYNEKDKQWQASISSDKDRIYLGGFKNKEEAIKVRKDAEIKYGFHKNHGKTKEEIDDE